MSSSRQLRADVYVVTHSRPVRWVAGAAVVLAGAVTLGLTLGQDPAAPVADLTTAFGQGEVLIDPVTGLLVAALVAAHWGAGYRDGSILWSYMAGPSRAHVAVAALLVSVVLGVVLGVAAMLVKVLCLHLTLPDGTAPMWWQDQHGRVALLGAVVAAAVLALVGACASLITRSAAASIAVLFGWMLVVEPLVVGLLPKWSWTLLPAHSLSAIRNAVPEADLRQAALSVVCYTALAVAAAIVMTRRRDPA